MHLLSLTPMLQSSDLDRTEAWYAAVLGFRCAGRAEGWRRLERDGVVLMFMANDHLGRPAATATQYIEVDDVQALWSAVRTHVPAEWGPEEMPYGKLEFAIRDPDGYLLSFGQTVTVQRSERATEPAET